MKALTFKRYGRSPEIGLVDIPRPTLKPNELLVEVQAVGLNPIDTMIPKGTDPCDPGRRFALMFVNGATGGAASRTGVGNVGPVIGSPAPPPEPQQNREGEFVMPPIPGLPPSTMNDINTQIKAAAPYMPWHRGAWKELLDLQ